MSTFIQLLIGIVIILLGFPIGSLLAKSTKEELKQGKKYFRLIIFISAVGVIASLIFQNDPLFFSFLFFMAVTSKSLR